MDPAELIRLAGTKAKGKRPHFFTDPDIDRLVAITLALAGELAVARERIDTLERLLQAKDVIAREEIEEYVPDDEAAAQRGRWQQEYLARILRVLQQEIEALQEGEGEASAEQVARELAP